MASERFEAIVEDFEFLEDWEDRYRYVIEQGKAMDPLPEALRVQRLIEAGRGAVLGDVVVHRA